MTAYTALKGLVAPGTNVFGYQRGDAVSADVVDRWGLTLGEPGHPDADVCEGPLPTDQGDAVVVVPRPDEAANRAAWEAYAIANGMNVDAAAEASLEDLQAERDTRGHVVERPADTAKKADWVAYVKAVGADESWADADSTTKADLQAWTVDTPTPTAPVVGDPVAVAATNAVNQPG